VTSLLNKNLVLDFFVNKSSVNDVSGGVPRRTRTGKKIDGLKGSFDAERASVLCKASYSRTVIQGCRLLSSGIQPGTPNKAGQKMLSR